MRLSEKIIFLTGSGGLLGRQYIRSFLDNGAKVIATELEGDRLSTLFLEFGEHSNAFIRPMDVSSESEIEETFRWLKENSLIPDVFINNAAITGELLLGEGASFPDFNEVTLESWNKTLDVNLTGPFLVAREIDRQFVPIKKVKLINVASMYASNAPHHQIYDGLPFNNFSGYSVSKAGIHGLTLWLASYWGKSGSTVNTISPGAIFNSHDDIFVKRVKKLTMLDRMGLPEEIADAMLFLCSDDSRYMTGQNLNVDGGFSGW